MLGKLIKYEFQATGRVLLPLYGALVVVALITNVLLVTNAATASAISIFVFVGLCVASAVMTLLIIIQRFRNNLLSDEGYLMFTLPTTAGRLIWAKLIVALCWMLIGPLVGMFSSLVLFLNGDMIAALPTVFSQWLPRIFGGMGFYDWMLVLEVFVFFIVEMCAFFTAVYLSMAVAQLPSFARHRRLFALLTFFVLYIIFFTIIANLTPGIDLTAATATVGATLGAGALAILCQAALFAVLFFGTWYILKNKLNLE